MMASDAVKILQNLVEKNGDHRLDFLDPEWGSFEAMSIVFEPAPENMIGVDNSPRYFINNV